MDKELLLKRIKEMLKEEGKEHLLDFAEELAELAWKMIGVIVELSDTKIDDVVYAQMDAFVKGYLDKIDGKQEA